MMFVIISAILAGSVGMNNARESYADEVNKKDKCVSIGELMIFR